MPGDQASGPRRVFRVLLVGDHPAVRHGLALLLEAEGVGHCCEAAGRAEAMTIAGGARPDVALVDLSLDDDGTFALVADLRARQIPVLVCSRYEDPAHVRRALTAGARGYLAQCEAHVEAARAVRGVLDGWMLVSPRAAERLDEE